MDLKTQIKTKGYVIINNSFTSEELQKIKEEIISYTQTHSCLHNSSGITIPDFIKRPELANVSTMKTNQHIHTVLQTILGDNYRFCQHNDIGINRIVGWHKDKLNGVYGKYETIDIWKSHQGETHQIVKVLTYLEDHTNDNHALKLVPGSHLIRNVNSKGFIQMHPKLGDTIIFDQRITHRGMTQQQQYPRILVSFGFGKNNIFTDNFEKGTIERQNKQNKNYMKQYKMIIKVAHIYASNASHNSGDFMLGIATKKYFKEVILTTDNKVEFTNFDCRKANLYKPDNIEKLNDYDYILVGGGGLILPDSAPNKVSGWQWIIPKKSYKKITSPIYVVSIGYNLFFNQTMNMPSRSNNNKDLSRMPIFKDNITALIDRATHFTMRHRGDIDRLCEIIGPSYKSKVRFEFCPVHWYVQNYWTPIKNNKKSIAIEIKDDRQWRRYHKIGQQNYYNALTKFVQYCLKKGTPILYLSHDGSRSFYNHLKQKGITIPYLDNSCANEKKILENYSKIHTILCSAGHSQMISHGLGIRIISMITHPKLKRFCKDIRNNEYIDVNHENVLEKLLRMIP